VKRALTTLAATALACAVIAPAAEAHTIKYETTVTAKVKKGGKDAGTISGAVDSTSPRCVIDREVKVFQHVDNADDLLLGSDRTDDAGVWELPTLSLTTGSYYALAAKSVLKKNKRHRHVCKRAASKDLSVK